MVEALHSIERQKLLLHQFSNLTPGGFVVQRIDLELLGDVTSDEETRLKPEAFDPIFGIYETSSKGNIHIEPMDSTTPVEITTGKLVVAHYKPEVY